MQLFYSDCRRAEKEVDVILYFDGLLNLRQLRVAHKGLVNVQHQRDGNGFLKTPITDIIHDLINIERNMTLVLITNVGPRSRNFFCNMRPPLPSFVAAKRNFAIKSQAIFMTKKKDGLFFGCHLHVCS